MDWSDRAACLSAEPELFFPIGSAGLAADDITAAKAICAGCSVLEQCRDYALRSRQPFGVWGGLDEDQRRAIWAGSPSPALVS